MATTFVCALELSHFTTIYNHISNVTKSKLLSTCVRMSTTDYQINIRITHIKRATTIKTHNCRVYFEILKSEREIEEERNELQQQQLQQTDDQTHRKYGKNEANRMCKRK